MQRDAACTVSFMKTLGKHEEQRGAWQMPINEHKGGGESHRKAGPSQVQARLVC